jgi:hypothetical protein
MLYTSTHYCYTSTVTTAITPLPLPLLRICWFSLFVCSLFTWEMSDDTTTDTAVAALAAAAMLQCIHQQGVPLLRC